MTPASTVKIMTAELVFRELAEGRLKLDDEFVVSEHAWRDGGARAGGSAMFLQVNSHVRVEDLIRGLVINSGNDAAITLAEGVAGAEEAFVMRMNKRGSELGLTKSSFGNPWGQAGPDQKVTAAGHGAARRSCDQNLSGLLPLFRREGIHSGTRSSSRTAIRC